MNAICHSVNEHGVVGSFQIFSLFILVTLCTSLCSLGTPLHHVYPSHQPWYPTHPLASFTLAFALFTPFAPQRYWALMNTIWHFVNVDGVVFLLGDGSTWTLLAASELVDGLFRATLVVSWRLMPQILGRSCKRWEDKRVWRLVQKVKGSEG